MSSRRAATAIHAVHRGAHTFGVVVLALLALLPLRADGQVTEAKKCFAAKLKALSNEEGAVINCWAKGTASGDQSMFADCGNKAAGKLTAAFAKATGCGGTIAECSPVADDCFVHVALALPDLNSCEAAKLKAAAKKAKAKLTCWSKAAGKGVAVDAPCLAKASAKFTVAFAKAGTCTGDVATIEAVVDTECVTPVVGANPVVTAICSAPCSFVDNGNGTITDNCTGLMWEKKDRSNGAPTIHPVNSTRAWAGTCSSNSSSSMCQGTYFTSAELCATQTGGGVVEGCSVCGPGEGTCSENYTMWSWLVDLNYLNFAGHSDWRIPTLAELQTIVDRNAPGCGGGAAPCVPAVFNNNCIVGCTVMTCSCTQADFYWSATTDATYPYLAWLVSFDDGSVGRTLKDDNYYVRAVRAGS